MSTDGQDDGIIRVEAIEAKAIYLVDSSGSPRASLTCSEGGGQNHGHVVIHLHDQNGIRLSLQVDDKEGASISMFNQSASPCISVSALNSRGNGITICDSEGRPRINAGIENGDSSADITVLNPDGDV